MNPGTFEFQGEVESPRGVEPFDADRMPALFQGKLDRLLDPTVQSVVVDHEFTVDEQSASVVTGQMKGMDTGFADSKKAFEDETAVFVASTGRCIHPIGDVDLDRNPAG